MKLEDKLEYILERKDYLFRLETVETFIIKMDPSLKLANLYWNSRHNLNNKISFDNPKILLIHLLYKILKDNESRGEV